MCIITVSGHGSLAMVGSVLALLCEMQVNLPGMIFPYINYFTIQFKNVLVEII